jgi:hypothetical protein
LQAKCTERAQNVFRVFGLATCFVYILDPRKPRAAMRLGIQITGECCNQ